MNVSDSKIWKLRKEAAVLLEEEITSLERENLELKRLIDERDRQIRQMEYKLVSIQESMKRLGLSDRRIRTSFFDSHFYLRANPDLREHGVDPVVHYVFYGLVEGRPAIPEKQSSLVGKLLFSGMHNKSQKKS